jgi:hypothetical protein
MRQHRWSASRTLPICALITAAACAPMAAGVTCPSNSAFVANASVCVDLYEGALVVGGKVWDPCSNVDDLAVGSYSAIPAKGACINLAWRAG